MTLAELARFMRSYQRQERQRAQERAAYDYMLAGLIARNVGSYLSEEITVPTLQEAYSGLFEDKAQEIKQEKENRLAELSAIRFRQFASYHNRKYNN